MLERGSYPTVPTRVQLETKLLDLIQGRCSREEVSAWAEQWIRMDNPPDMDPIVWDVLDSLSGADMISTDRPYLYTEDDFRAWLEELRQ